MRHNCFWEFIRGRLVVLIASFPFPSTRSTFLLNLSIRLEIQHYITHLSMNNHPHNHMVCLTHKSISLFYAGHQVRLQGQGRAGGQGGGLAHGEQKWKIDGYIGRILLGFFSCLSMANKHITGFLLFSTDIVRSMLSKGTISPVVKVTHFGFIHFMLLKRDKQ